MWDAVSFVAHQYEISPPRQYLKSLNWKGDKNAIRKLLPTYLGTEDTELNAWIMKHMILGLVKRVFEPGSKFDEMMVLVGGQGIGKSTFARYLAIKDDWFCTIENIQGKDAVMNLMGKTVVEIEEFVALRNAKSANEAKSFLSKLSDRIRIPYEKFSTDVPRTCILIGTLNERTFLNDHTGERRYLPVECHKEKRKKAIYIDKDFQGEQLEKEYLDSIDHICDFMCKAVGVNKNSRILDPCCGSGAFLVRAMTEAMDDCETEEDREYVKRNQIFGIEYEDGAFGLSSTNMLIHGDGNSNVVQASMFERGEWIRDNNINVVLMNPPYNATRKFCDPEYTKTWGANRKEDPSKGFHFVEWVARHVPSTCKIAVLLPMQAAIGNSSEIKKFKKKMLDNYTLDGVFSLPNEMFYPGAAAIACCMIFDLSQKHDTADRDTFFGYFKDDQFIKRKGLGRVERTDSEGNSLWVKNKELWLNLYKNKIEVPGLSVMQKVTWKDEWLAEAYMETDYSLLGVKDFETTIRDYYSYLIKVGK